MTVMRTHQKFLPVRGPGGLLPHFIAVMDNDADRKGFIAKGCEWVLNARLADARFFFDEDVAEVARVEAARALAPDVPGEARRLSAEDRADPGSRRGDRPRGRPRGSRRSRCGPRRLLSKADLVSHGRQGVHGPAGHRGRDLRAAGAAPGLRLEGHLRPVPPGFGLRRAARARRRERCSRSPTASTRSPGFFRLGLVPTGSKDPYGLRRAAAGHRLDRDRPQLADRLAPGRPQGALPLPGGAQGPGRRGGHRGARPLLRGPAAQPPRAARLQLRRDLGGPQRRSLGLRRRGRPRPRPFRGPPAHGLPLADPGLQADPQHRRRRARPARPARALPRGGGARARRRLPAGQAGDRGLHRGAGATARPWRRSPRSPRRSTASSSTSSSTAPEPKLRTESAGAAGLDSARIHAPGGLFGNRGGENEERVFSFGNGVAEGVGPRQGNARGQGSGPRRDDGPRDPGAAGIHDRDLGLRRLLRAAPRSTASGRRSSRP